MKQCRLFLLGIVILLWCMPSRAQDIVIADTLRTDTTRNERLERYLEQVFGKRPDQIATREDAKKRTGELHVLKVSGGVSLITSDLQVGDDAHEHLPGLEYMLEFEDIFDKGRGRGRGVGFIFKGSRYRDGYLRFNLYHFGLNRVWCNMPSSSHWRWELALGGGASYLHDKSDFSSFYYYADDSKFGLGVLLKAGIESRLSKHVGLGLEANTIYHIFFDSNSKVEDKPINGIVSTDLMLGLRFYF